MNTMFGILKVHPDDVAPWLGGLRLGVSEDQGATRPVQPPQALRLQGAFFFFQS